jgi:hypothetical protein
MSGTGLKFRAKKMNDKQSGALQLLPRLAGVYHEKEFTMGWPHFAFCGYFGDSSPWLYT